MEPFADLTRTQFDELVVEFDDNTPEKRFVLNTDSFIIGRGTKCDITIEHPRISREHILLERNEDDAYFVTDLGSTNKTWLNNIELAPRTKTLWTPGDIVRIGDLWLRIEQVGSTYTLSDTVPLPESPLLTLDDDEQEAVPEETFRSLRPSITPREHQVAVIAIPDSIAVHPGGNGNIMLEIINQGTLADQFIVSVTGIPESWFTPPEQSVYVDANTSQLIALPLHPPRISTTTLGYHHFSVHIQSLNHVDVNTAAQVQVQITPFQALSTALRPDRLEHNQFGFLRIDNLGNTPTSFRIVPNAPEDNIIFQVPQDTVNVQPGNRVEIPITLLARNRALVGERKLLPFDLNIQIDNSGISQTQSGLLIVPPRISTFTIAFISIALMAGCIGTFIFGLFQLNVANQQATATAITATAEQVATENALGTQNAIIATESALTATAVSDNDEDGIPLNEELEGGTDPEDADSDDDGLTDSQEIALGTAPNNPDTDGDGMPDGVDLDPLNPLMLDDPVETVRFYYEQVQAKNFDLTFTFLTPNFLLSEGTSNQEEYEAWWNRVASTEVGDAVLVSQNGNIACVYVPLTYTLVDGTIVWDDEPYIVLEFDPVRNLWLFDDKVGFYGHW